ncbi:MAG TPA: hypothetical protein VKR42_00730, partial [Ktedonobacteraceae bacterium]|nr:hypothetical protein [Ktedonobacteraceae bacterium]
PCTCAIPRPVNKDNGMIHEKVLQKENIVYAIVSRLAGQATLYSIKLPEQRIFIHWWGELHF